MDTDSDVTLSAACQEESGLAYVPGQVRDLMAGYGISRGAVAARPRARWCCVPGPACAAQRRNTGSRPPQDLLLPCAADYFRWQQRRLRTRALLHRLTGSVCI